MILWVTLNRSAMLVTLRRSSNFPIVLLWVKSFRFVYRISCWTYHTVAAIRCHSNRYTTSNSFYRNAQRSLWACFTPFYNSHIMSYCICVATLLYLTLVDFLIGLSVRSAFSFWCYTNFFVLSLIFAHYCILFIYTHLIF